MARLARVVVPGYPHHITQRGNRRQKVFFCDEDYRAYRDLMSHWCRFYGIDVWSYCLMPNHVHLLAVSRSEDGLARAIGEAHRRYTRMVNFREGWRVRTIRCLASAIDKSSSKGVVNCQLPRPGTIKHYQGKFTS